MPIFANKSIFINGKSVKLCYIYLLPAVFEWTTLQKEGFA